jgi:hypothetical protein
MMLFLDQSDAQKVDDLAVDGRDEALGSEANTNCSP